MPISCVAFGCTNKQKSQEKKGEGGSSREKSPENNEISSPKQNIAFHSCPSDDALREILMSASRVSFYGFLIALTKSEVINKTVGVLPDKPSLIDIADQETPLTTPRSASSRVRNTGTIKKGSK